MRSTATFNPSEALSPTGRRLDVHRIRCRRSSRLLESRAKLIAVGFQGTMLCTRYSCNIHLYIQITGLLCPWGEIISGSMHPIARLLCLRNGRGILFVQYAYNRWVGSAHAPHGPLQRSIHACRRIWCSIQVMPRFPKHQSFTHHQSTNFEWSSFPLSPYNPQCIRYFSPPINQSINHVGCRAMRGFPLLVVSYRRG
jgi:hypothetical protein